MVKNLAGAEIRTHGLSTRFVLCQLRLHFGALQPPSVQPTWALSSGQYSGSPACVFLQFSDTYPLSSNSVVTYVDRLHKKETHLKELLKTNQKT